eukprot:scaffold14371_cov18-Tisochrysis_lutea.AAC.5
MARLEHNYREDTIMIKEMGRAINSLTAKQGPKTKRAYSVSYYHIMCSHGQQRTGKLSPDPEVCLPALLPPQAAAAAGVPGVLWTRQPPWAQPIYLWRVVLFLELTSWGPCAASLCAA